LKENTKDTTNQPKTLLKKMSNDDEKFHQQKLDELICIIDQIELYKSKNPETDLLERKNIERKILLCPEYKDFINKYFDFLKHV